MSLVEQWKYEKCYRTESYRMGPQRRQYAATDIDSMLPGTRYLDVGCGRGEMLERARDNGMITQGIETVPELCDGERVMHGDACHLPFEDASFDYLSCYDVLEHLVPGEEQQALDEFKRVCKGVVFLSTNDRPSFLGDIDLHINKRTQADWHRDIVARWPNATFTLAGAQGDWHWCCPR